jgi:hypothetical protein
MKRIAPVLQDWLSHGAYTLNEDLLPTAAKELRALLAVARAAQRLRDCGPDEVDRSCVECDNALDRLAKVARKGRR